MTANSRRHWLGGTCLATGVIALALAIIPPTVHGRPLNLPWRVEEKPAEAPQVAEVRTEPRVNLRLGKLSVGFGEKQVAVPQPPPVPAAPPPDPLRWYTVAAVSFALLGLVLAPIAWVRKEHPAYALSALALCTTALTWQYVAFGIAAGAAVAAFLVVLALLGGALAQGGG